MATNHVLTALFDSRANAERCVEHLVQRCGIDRSAVRVHAGGEATIDAGTHTGRDEAHHGFVAPAEAATGRVSPIGLPDALPAEDRAAFAGHLQKGGIVVIAALPDPVVDAAIEACETNGAVAIDERSGRRRDRR